MTDAQARYCEAKVKSLEERTKKAKSLEELSRTLGELLGDPAYVFDENDNLIYRPEGW